MPASLEWLNNQADPKLLAQEKLIVQTSETIWECLEKKRVTTEELANSLGMSHQVLLKVLSGELPMTLRTLAIIAECLGIDVKFELKP